MTVEARELYLYTTGTRPFMDSLAKKDITAEKVKEIVRDAIGTYISDYCTNKENPFTDNDKESVIKNICADLL